MSNVYFLLNAHNKEFLSPPSMKMATEHVIYFFFVSTRFFVFIRDYTPIFGKYFHGKRVSDYFVKAIIFSL